MSNKCITLFIKNAGFSRKKCLTIRNKKKLILANYNADKRFKNCYIIIALPKHPVSIGGDFHDKLH